MADVVETLFPDGTSSTPYADDEELPFYPSCECYSDARGLDCADDGFETPPSLATVTRDVLQNITGQPEADFLYYTTDIYRLSRFKRCKAAFTVLRATAHSHTWNVVMHFVSDMEGTHLDTNATGSHSGLLFCLLA